MRSFITSILLLAIMLPTISPWGTIAYFHFNRDYIARVLCENRDKPQLNCDGKCYLAKKLKQQQDKQDKETTERVQNSPVLQLFTQPVFAFDFLHSESFFGDEQKVSFYYNLLRYSTPCFGILQPPKIY
ncbi:hypothetical protein [Dyadobacter sp. LHD-138]|uniref:hypothetical protein n=1 Tax=Dyadobacter sp. LHD-138 TaxID=3071413 RepID=UPI0027E19E2F|nr:hypothetical protein [Dyadobacter sp. LHD-138]MDQ6477606.1 hypothetical protein [Dyadobacter sp. LHD-138]